MNNKKDLDNIKEAASLLFAAARFTNCNKMASALKAEEKKLNKVIFKEMKRKSNENKKK